MPALDRMHNDRSDNVPWVPMLQWRAGGCWTGAGPRPAARPAAPASSGSLVINAGRVAEPGDAQRIGVLHT